MSSGPSHECLYGNPSGTILFNIISISSLQEEERDLLCRSGSIRAIVFSRRPLTHLTSGSQLSFNAKLADV